MDQLNGVLAPLPNVHGRHFVPGIYDTTFSFNPQRFRGRGVYTPEPGQNVLRIATLGASFTFGSGANDVDAYPFQLQSILQEKSRNDGWILRVEVINAGIAGSVTAEQALWYENWVKGFHPGVVILNVACAVDHPTGLFQIDSRGEVAPRSAGEVNTASRQGLAARKIVHHIPGFTFLAEHSELFNLFRLAEGEFLRHKRDAALGVDPIASDPTKPPRDVVDQELRVETAEVRWLKQQVNKSGATFIVVVLPCRENIYPSKSKWGPRIRSEYPRVVNALRQLSVREAIPVAELSPVFMERATGKTPLYYDGKFETHPTPAGYRVIAEGVANFLVEQGVVPGSRPQRAAR
jgi:lysophospholipase L1-like esterase